MKKEEKNGICGWPIQKNQQSIIYLVEIPFQTRSRNDLLGVF